MKRRRRRTEQGEGGAERRDDGAEDWKEIGKEGAVDLDKFIETGLVIFQIG